MAGVVGLWAFYRLPELGMLRAVGISFLAVVLLGPSLQPWYLVWGIVILAAAYGPRIATGIRVVHYSRFVPRSRGSESSHHRVGLSRSLVGVPASGSSGGVGHRSHRDLSGSEEASPTTPGPHHSAAPDSAIELLLSWRPTGSGGRPDLEWARISGRFGSRLVVLLEVVREHTGNGGSLTEPGSGKQP